MTSLFHRFYYKLRDSFAARINYRLLYDQRALQLQQSMLSSSVRGVSNEQIADTEVVVSLTTHHRRLFEVYLAIESIMQGSVRPNRIILWLSSELENQLLPISLQNQCSRGLEVRYTTDIGPYTKLIPALQAFPESAIVTIDDDIIYPFDTLEMLLSAYHSHHVNICANRILDVQKDSRGGLKPLFSWPELLDKSRISYQNFFEGVGGVLYPPHCFSAEVSNIQTFRSICPSADDVWFNCMALLNHTDVIPSNNHYTKFPLLINESIQDTALWRVNNKNSGTTPNDVQLTAVMSRYSLHY